MIRTLICTAAIATALPAADAWAQSWQRIKTEQQFRDLVVGRTGVSEGHRVKVHANGRMSGNIKGRGKINGAWAWSGSFWCRNLNVGGEALGQNCQTVHISGNQVRYTQDKGRGRASVWTLK